MPPPILIEDGLPAWTWAILGVLALALVALAVFGLAGVQALQ